METLVAMADFQLRLVTAVLVLVTIKFDPLLAI